ncbi:MAG: hypothetical protein K6T78_04275 [Alicyclobacillus sp.]|nr:hypothetical protein [Alicyclobacillus sp.]
MSERTVLASFYSEPEANVVADQIRDLGVETVQVDTLHRYPTPRANHWVYTLSGEVPSLASLTLDTTPGSRDAAVLMAADPAASGMSDGQGNITGRNYLLTAVCPEDLVETVVQLIRDGNGYT